MKKSVPALHQIIGRNLKEIRQKACLSQSKLGQERGVSFQQIQKYEKGLNRLPTEHVHALKHFFGVPYERFFYSLNDPAYNHESHDPNCVLTEDFIRRLEKIDDQTLKTKALKILTVLID